MAGLKVSEEVVDAWTKIRMDHSLRFVSFKLSDDGTKVVLEKTIKKDAKEHDQLIDEDVAMDGPRYLAINISYTDKEGKKLEKLCLVFWCPEGTKIKDRMIASSTFKDVKAKCTGAAKYFEIQDRGELSYEEFVSELKRGK